MKTMTQTCHHGRPIEGLSFWEAFKGQTTCLDCDVEDRQQIRPVVVVGLIALLVVLLAPAVLILAGVFW